MAERAVFDCMLFLQAAINAKCPAFRCFELAEKGIVRLQLSPPIVAEVHDVLNRAELRRKFTALTPDRVATFLRRALAISEMHATPPSVLTLARDPDDEPYTDLAIATNARYLVSRDRDLLDLMNPEPREGQDLLRRCPNLRVLDPSTFLLAVTRNEPQP